MAGVSTDQGSGKKLDVDLNLVPFIDLLSTLVLFLLLTVVWTQTAAVPASVESKGKSKTAEVTPGKLIVTVTESGIQISWPSTLAGRGFPQSLAKIESLVPVLKKIVAEGKMPPTTVVGHDGVEYGTIIQVLDAVKESGILMVGLSTD